MHKLLKPVERDDVPVIFDELYQEYDKAVPAPPPVLVEVGRRYAHGLYPDTGREDAGEYVLRPLHVIARGDKYHGPDIVGIEEPLHLDGVLVGAFRPLLKYYLELLPVAHFFQVYRIDIGVLVDSAQDQYPGRPCP